MTKKVTGIVINKQSYDDNSEIVTIFTKELGKLAFLLRGSKNYFKKSICCSIFGN
ncbi:recombination protein O N-terminal domain-containing protein [Spiroplasma endosymbiont of Stenodema calcarata]|uniref:recombination protein O N-terminal domain-containing protein n=1 Tax=Spiroplasma endosymbiont of Stenodema calcarata TaxID=3139328 RepID=UPI003CCB3032